MKRPRWLSVITVIVLLLAFCRISPLQASAASSGKGELTYAEDAGNLTKRMEKLLLDYMHSYYTSLMTLKTGNPSELFAPDSADNLKLNRAAWDVLVKLRKMQDQDLSLTGYSFTLEVRSITKEENGDYRVNIRESWIQSFKAYPGVDSKGFLVGHLFVLTKDGDNWLIREHRQFDSLYQRLYGNWKPDNPSSSPRITTNKNNILSEAEKAVAARAKQGKKKKNIEFDNEYNRKKAVAYARKYVGVRSSKYFAYDRYGGNCQNFASQAVRAGGIPMDYTSPGLWKYFSNSPNNRFNNTGRSLSWASVSNFLAYAKSNSGYGLVSHVDAPYYTGEPGDLLLMSAGGSWKHVVMITKVMKDSSGKTVDYLVASNTADVKDFPASAYHYNEQTLVKILGWNDEPVDN